MPEDQNRAILSNQVGEVCNPPDRTELPWLQGTKLSELNHDGRAQSFQS